MNSIILNNTGFWEWMHYVSDSPGYERYIEKIAEIKGLSVKEVEEQTEKNAISFFNLKLKK